MQRISSGVPKHLWLHIGGALLMKSSSSSGSGEARRPVLFMANNWMGQERAFHISRPDHQSLTLSPSPFPSSLPAAASVRLANLILGLASAASSLHLDAWCFQYRVFALHVFWKGDYHFLLPTSLSSLCRSFDREIEMWQHQKDDSTSVYAPTH